MDNQLITRTRGWALALLCTFSAGCATLDRPGIREARGTGFSAERLDTLTRFMQSRIDIGHLPGTVMMIAYDGKVVYSKALGARDPKAKTHMTEDAIFRMHSMTKVVVSVAAMMLVEEGKLQLGEPISRYIPELKDLKVGVEKTAPDGKRTLELVAAKSPISVLDLMRHTGGFTYDGTDTLVEQEYERVLKGITGADDFLRKVASLPLAHQPGTTWEYSVSHDILGIVVERISGKPLSAFLTERIFQPLKMEDTDFWVQPSKQHRIAQPFEIDPDTKQPVPITDPTRPPAMAAGGGSLSVGNGLVSTARDYLRFSQMLQNGGQLDGVRLISRKSAEAIGRDQLDGITGGPGPEYGWGLGVAVRKSTAGATFGSRGDVFWGGGAGTAFIIDPSERFIAVRLSVARASRGYYNRAFRNLVYSALE